MKKILIAIAVAAMTFALSSCGTNFRKASEKSGFNAGMAITPGDILDPALTKIIQSDCNILVYENSMKWANLRPNKTFWNWSDIDHLIKFAEENKMKVKWHTLFWHQQNSSFVSSNWTREQALEMMDEHIEKVMSRYKGKISEYDVVNEMFEEDGSYRENLWYKTIGPDYLEHALRKAHEVDPTAKLYFNEYNNEEKGNPKADAMYNLVKDFKERGVPIDGVGFQLHLAADLNYSEEAIRANIKRYADLGIDISFSELDIRVPTNGSYDQAQKDLYVMIYKLAKENPNVKSVITWGISDKHNWVPSTFHGYGNAMLYDKDLKKKPVYEAVFNELSK